MTRIGILGGTFDPIHRGHVDLGLAAQRVLALTGVRVMPSNRPPHKPQPAASPFHRFAMAAIAVAGHPGWQASDFELTRDQPSYTVITLRRLHAEGCAPEELFFLLGADAFAGIASWKEYPTVLDAAHFVVVSRPGHSTATLRDELPALASRMTTPTNNPPSYRAPSIILIDAPTTDASSSVIRERCANGWPIGDLVAPGVEEHIERHGLYASLDSDRRVLDDPQHPAAGRLHGQS